MLNNIYKLATTAASKAASKASIDNNNTGGGTNNNIKYIDNNIKYTGFAYQQLPQPSSGTTTSNNKNSEQQPIYSLNDITPTAVTSDNNRRKTVVVQKEKDITFSSQIQRNGGLVDAANDFTVSFRNSNNHSNANYQSGNNNKITNDFDDIDLESYSNNTIDNKCREEHQIFFSNNNDSSKSFSTRMHGSYGAAQQNNNDAQQSNNSFKSKVIMQFETFEQVLHYIKPFGRYQIWFAVCHQLAVLAFCGNFTFFSFGMIEPLVFCDQNDDIIESLDFYNPHFINLNKSLLLMTKENKIDCSALKQCENSTKLITNRFLSVVQEWNLFCDSNYIPHFMLTMQMVGSLCGSQIAGYLADNFGRKTIFIATLAGLLITSIISATLIHDWVAFTVTRFIIGLLADSCLLAGFTWSMELTDTTHNVKMNMSHLWQFAYMIVPLIGYLTQHWRTYLLVINIVSLPLIVVFALFCESPRWLIQSKRYGRAAKCLQKIAKCNGLNEEEIHKIQPTSLASIKVDIKDRHYTVYHLFCSSTVILKYTAIMFFAVFSADLIASTFVYNVRNLAGNPFLDIFVYGLLRSWIPFAIYFADRRFAWFGRRLLFLGTVSIIVGSFGSVCILYAFETHTTHYASLITVFALIGAVFVAPIWVVLGQYAIELFPTVIRNIAGAFTSIGGQLGGIVTPQLLYLDNFWPALPYLCVVVIAILNVIMGYFCFPETKGIKLPDTLHSSDIPVQDGHGKVKDDISPLVDEDFLSLEVRSHT